MANRKVIFDIESKDNTGKGIKSTESGLKKLTKSLTAVTGVGLGAAAAFTAISVAAKKSVAAASDLAETTSKVGIVFGDASNRVLAFGKTAADSFGMSENAALAAAATYGNLFRSMGMAEAKSAEMSMNLVKLAADLASFNNLDPTEVFEKLRAGLTGEAEPLKSLGVNINETVIKMRALELGLYNGKGALDASTKATAAYDLIMEQTALAQGDFARTSDGLANQQRILKAQMEDLAAVMGTKLTPVTTDFLVILNELISRMDIGGDSAEDFGSSLWDWMNVYKVLPAAMAAVAAEIQSHDGSMKQYVKTLKDVPAAIEEIMAVDLAMVASLTTIENEYLSNAESNNAELLTLMEKRATLKKQGYSDESKAIKDIDAALDINAQNAEENATAHELATNRIILSYATQLLAADGLTQEEAEFLLQKGVDMGIYSEDAVEKMGNVITEANNLKDAINNIPNAKTIKIDFSGAPIPNFSKPGDQEDHLTAAGTSGFTVPPGFTHDNFSMGLSSGERVEVTPASRVGSSDKGSGGGGNTYVFNATGITNPDEFLKYVGQKVKQQGGL